MTKSYCDRCKSESKIVFAKVERLFGKESEKAEIELCRSCWDKLVQAVNMFMDRRVL